MFDIYHFYHDFLLKKWIAKTIHFKGLNMIIRCFEGSREGMLFVAVLDTSIPTLGGVVKFFRKKDYINLN